MAKYFVIHDTSYNLCEVTNFPDNQDVADARWNLASRWENNDNAHLFITRDGKSVNPQGRTFADAW